MYLSYVLLTQAVWWNGADYLSTFNLGAVLGRDDSVFLSLKHTQITNSFGAHFIAVNFNLWDLNYTGTLYIIHK